MTHPMRLGKLDNDRLEELVLNKFDKTRPESATVPEVGLYCAMLDLSGDLAILSCDPITSAKLGSLGALTVHVSCNDAAAAGADPVGLLITLLAPPEATFDEIGHLADDIALAAKNVNVDILGGHTEVTDSVTRYVTNTTVIARLSKDRVMRGMRPGDDIVLTKWAALEGSAIIAEDYKELLAQLPETVVTSARAFTKYFSVVPESRIAIRNGATAMHDVTEGGVLGACWEMGYVAKCGMEIDAEKIPVLPETVAICELLSLDPFRLISSGSMLIACQDGKALVYALQNAGIHASVIGKATPGSAVQSNGTLIDPPGADELYRLSSF